ncbi:hypothetical protein DSM104299_02185 [Baekduia alba]|uniref:SRPBCC family protein n=1 Tax=Baekduia alba TaxID=2997333 RepID=UPI0023405D87|nr:SRPBCC family protein [Baekduia alba]WCB93472.1 hypothetical protein DSM104299_02185 [Baekduia alba]
MPTATYETRIDRPAEEVFDFLADGTNNPRWQPGVVATAAPAPAGPPAVGSAFHQTARHPLGFKVPADYRLTTVERPHALALVATAGGPIRPTLRYELSEDAPGVTTVRSTVAYRPTGLHRWAAPLLVALRPLLAWEARWIDRARDALIAAPRA